MFSFRKFFFIPNGSATRYLNPHLVRFLFAVAMRYGYACINVTLAEKKIVVNRGMIKRTFLEKGIAHASQLAYQNIQDLEKVIDWNVKRGMLFYRMSSDMFPWMSEYEIPDRDTRFTAVHTVYSGFTGVTVASEWLV